MPSGLVGDLVQLAGLLQSLQIINGMNQIIGCSKAFPCATKQGPCHIPKC